MPDAAGDRDTGTSAPREPKPALDSTFVQSFKQSGEPQKVGFLAFVENKRMGSLHKQTKKRIVQESFDYSGGILHGSSTET